VHQWYGGLSGNVNTGFPGRSAPFLKRAKGLPMNFSVLRNSGHLVIVSPQKLAKSIKFKCDKFCLIWHAFGIPQYTPMMQLTMTGEYAVRAMVHLSSLPHGSVVSIAAISREWDVPETFLRKIVTKLAHAGMITSFRGNGGGIALARQARELTLLDVVQATEGELSLNVCLLSPDTCHRTPWCAVHAVWCEAQQKLREVLSSRSLADLAASSLAHRR
jgi:Rrf2 family protein